MTSTASAIVRRWDGRFGPESRVSPILAEYAGNRVLALMMQALQETTGNAG